MSVRPRRDPSIQPRWSVRSIGFVLPLIEWTKRDRRTLLAFPLIDLLRIAVAAVSFAFGRFA